MLRGSVHSHAFFRSMKFPFPPIWTVWTVSLVETTIWKLLISVPLMIGAMAPLESLWSAKELLLYISFSTGMSGMFFILLKLLVFIIFRNESFFIPVGGTTGYIIALLIGFRHAFPYQEIINLYKIIPSPMNELLPARGILQARHLPFLCLVMELCLAVLAPAYFQEWPLALLSFLSSWVYIRYLMHFPYANLRGDHSSEFNFALLFPKFIRPTVDAFAGMIYAIIVRMTKGFLALRATDRTGLMSGGTLYSPADTAAAVAVISSLANNSSSIEDNSPDDRRLRTLKFLDDNIASLIGKRERFGSNDKGLTREEIDEV